MLSSYRYEKILISLMLAVTFLSLWAVLVYPIIDGDIWFHMLYAKVMLQQHSLVVDHTQFSWTPASNDFLYCAWIGQFFYYILYEYLGGEVGVLVFRYLISTLPFVLFLHISWQRGSLWQPLPWLACVISVLLMPMIVLDKPELISFFFSACMVWVWYQIRQCTDKRLLYIYTFPIIILIWVNTHGIFVFGCILLLAMVVGESCNQILYKKQALPRVLYRHLLVATAFAAGCTLLTPYGIDYILQLITSHFQAQNQQNLNAVMAWYPTFDLETPRIALFAYSAVVLLITTLLAALWKRQLDCSSVLINLLFAYLFTHYARLMYLWIPVFAFTVAYYGAATTPGPFRFRIGILLLACCLGSAGNVWGVYWQKKQPTGERWLEFGQSDYFTLAGEVAFITQHFPQAKIGNTYQHGGYLLWQRWPEQQVMMDARYFPYHAWFQEYLDFRAGKGVAYFLERYPADIIVVPHDHIELKKALFAMKQWNPVFLGKHALIYASVSQKGSALPIVHGEELHGVRNYQMALWILNSAILHRDWSGFDLLMNIMEANFTYPEQVDHMAGLRFFKPALEEYDRHRYDQALVALKKARQYRAFDRDIEAAVELMHGIQQWGNGEHQHAVQSTLRSLGAANTLAGTYNLSVMAWQLSRGRQGETLPDLGLPEFQAQSVADWRKILKNLADRPSHRPEYRPYIENAKKILAGDPGAEVSFIPASWL